jgi:glycosyltransferase involved in cell wall biosynthesis
MTNPLVSVVIPVYNGENYLEEAIQSCIQQTYKNIEIIVVDDGSSNPAAIKQICDQFEKYDLSYFWKTNGGVASALNLAISKSAGKYVSWLSHDDTYQAEKINLQVKLLEKLGKSNAAYSSYNIIDGSGEKTGSVDVKNILDKSATPLGPLERGALHGCSVLMFKEDICDVGMFDESLKYVQDIDLWLRCIESGIDFHLIEDCLVNSRVHKHQTGKTKDTFLEVSYIWDRISLKWVKFIEKNKMSDFMRLGHVTEYIQFLEETNVYTNSKIMDAAIKNLEEYHSIIIVKSSKFVGVLKKRIKMIIKSKIMSRIAKIYNRIN